MLDRNVERPEPTQAWHRLLLLFQGRNNSVGVALDCRAGGRGLDPRGRTNTQSRKITKKRRYCVGPANGYTLGGGGGALMTTSNGDPVSVANVNLVSLISTSFVHFFFADIDLWHFYLFFKQIVFPSLATRHQTWVIQRTKGQEDCSETLHYVEEKNRSKHYRHWIGESFISWCLFLLLTKMRTFEFKLALRSLTTPLVVDWSVSRQHASSSLETWGGDNFKVLLFCWKTLLLSMQCDILFTL